MALGDVTTRISALELRVLLLENLLGPQLAEAAEAQAKAAVVGVAAQQKADAAQMAADQAAAEKKVADAEAAQSAAAAGVLRDLLAAAQKPAAKPA